jgi:hypothetical protein
MNGLNVEIEGNGTGLLRKEYPLRPARPTQFHVCWDEKSSADAMTALHTKLPSEQYLSAAPKVHLNDPYIHIPIVYLYRQLLADSLVNPNPLNPKHEMPLYLLLTILIPFNEGFDASGVFCKHLMAVVWCGVEGRGDNIVVRSRRQTHGKSQRGNRGFEC